MLVEFWFGYLYPKHWLHISYPCALITCSCAIRLIIFVKKKILSCLGICCGLVGGKFSGSSWCTLPLLPIELFSDLIAGEILQTNQSQ